MSRKTHLTLIVLVSLICWSAMAIGGVDDGKLNAFSGAAFAIAVLYVFLPNLIE